MCRLSCTATLILSINKHRSTLPSRTTFINHNLSSALHSTPSVSFLHPSFLPLPPLSPSLLHLPLSVHLSLAFPLSNRETWSSMLKVCSGTTCFLVKSTFIFLEDSETNPKRFAQMLAPLVIYLQKSSF